jgi:DNA-binding XRE family transcriptional regulator
MIMCRFPEALSDRWSATPTLDASDCLRLRERAGWSREQLAWAAGVSTLTVLNFELDRRKPREETLIALRRAFRSVGLIGGGTSAPGAGGAPIGPGVQQVGDTVDLQAAPQLR